MTRSSTPSRARPRQVEPISSPRVSHVSPVSSPPSPFGAQPERSNASRVPGWITRAFSSDAPAPRVRRALAPGSIVPGTRYRVLRWLGEGGMGVVYEAEHIDIRRRVALKVIRSDFCDDPAVRRLLLEEARTANLIGSEYIVQIHDFLELPDGRVMMAMEYLDGSDLTSFLSPPMDPARMVGIMRQVCRGLAAAHNAGVIHRDIKPENVFITSRKGRADAVTILDFGIATLYMGSETVSASAVGTPDYLAPEIILEGRISPLSDMYAWGCVAYELLAGRPPCAAQSVTEVLVKHLESSMRPIRELVPSVPPALAAVIARCLARDPSARFASMVELEIALCEAQVADDIRTPWDDLPLPEVEGVRRERLLALIPDASLERRNRRGAAWLLSGALVLAGAFGAYLAFADSTETSSPTSEVEELTLRAREAASRAFFVYPPRVAPDTPTAYRVVRALEELPGDAHEEAVARAAELRREMSTTLVRLGDEFWALPGGQRFAVRYYEQALVFRGDLDRVRERVDAVEREIEALAKRAESASFSDRELRDGEVLAHLADPDPNGRAQALSAVAKSASDEQAEIARDVALLRGRHPGADSDPRGRATAPPGPTAEPEPEPATGGTEDPVEDVPPIPMATRNPAHANQIAQEGQRVLARGRHADAERLFERALGEDPRCVLAVAGLRDTAFERGNYHAAVKYARKVVTLQPKSGAQHLRLGDALYKVLRYKDAAAAYERASALGDERAQWRLEKVRGKLAD